VSIALAAQTASLPGLGSESILSFESAVGGAGNDTVTGTSGANRLDGSSGNDSLLGAAGNDTLGGGPGADTLDGQGGSDMADYGYALGGTLDLAAGSANLGAGDTDTLLGIERLTASQGRDTVIGSAVGDWVDGGRSNDLVQGAGGNDTLLGGLGCDTLDGAAGADSLAGGSGMDSLAAGAGNDTLTGGEGNDDLRGGAGADRLKLVSAAEGLDSLEDFASGTDKVQVTSANFGDLPVGLLDPARLVAAGVALVSGDAVFVYDGSTGALAFDADGNGAGAAVQIAALTGPKTLVASDIEVVAA
jgi:serralysin